MCKFQMRQVAGGKRQVYYDDRYETSKQINLMYDFDMRHVAGGKRQVYYDVGILIYEKEKKYA